MMTRAGTSNEVDLYIFLWGGATSDIVLYMKYKIIVLFLGVALVLGLAGSAEAARRVRGYYKPSTGSYIMPHYRTSPNSTRLDNWSTRGNSNPYTGRRGYASPYKLRW